MNYHLRPLSFKRYSLILSYSLLFMAISAWCMEFYFERLYGDLTRIGFFSERDFGWQIPQPTIPEQQFKNYPLAEADIFILGDSFSASRVWQTKLIATGLKVSTLTWIELKTDEGFPSNLGESLRSAGFKGRYVIIESIERVLQQRAESLTKIDHPISISMLEPPSLETQREHFSLNKPNGGGWGVKTLYNTIKLSLNVSEKHLKSKAVQPIKIDAEGCQLFSHRLCHYGLFIDGDFKKETFNAIPNVLAVNKNLQSVGIQPIWMIVPDKATVYLGYGARAQHPYQNIWQLFAQYPELIAPDLASAFIKQRRLIKDFYQPNDTHLSIRGFLYLGEFMNQEMRRIMATQP